MPLHYDEVVSIWDAHKILVSDLSIVDTWLTEGGAKVLPETMMLGMALGCRLAVETYLKVLKDHSHHSVPLSIKFKPAVAKPCGVFLPEAFTHKHKSNTTFVNTLVTLKN